MRRTFAVLGTIAALSLGVATEANAGANALPKTKIERSRGKLVPLPKQIPGERDTWIDSRISDDLVWITDHFPQVFVGEGYSGPLPGGGWSGCHGCHVDDSDHDVGLAVDIYPVEGSGRCDGSWNQITRLAKLAEPSQGHTSGPFEWVGYDGDAGHGCGHHLHLSWNHSPRWVEIFTLRDWLGTRP